MHDASDEWCAFLAFSKCIKCYLRFPFFPPAAASRTDTSNGSTRCATSVMRDHDAWQFSLHCVISAVSWSHKLCCLIARLLSDFTISPRILRFESVRTYRLQQKASSFVSKMRFDKQPAIRHCVLGCTFSMFPPEVAMMRFVIESTSVCRRSIFVVNKDNSASMSLSFFVFPSNTSSSSCLRLICNAHERIRRRSHQSHAGASGRCS